MKKIALIGASGFVGSRLIEIAKNKYALKNIDKLQSEKYPEFTSICDVRDKANLISEFRDQNVVILLAAEHRDDVSPISAYYDVNVQGTKNVLEAMDENGVKSIIFTSSVAIYGLNKINPNENDPAAPFNHYGKSKWQAEEILREWHQGDSENRSLTIIRPTVIFGENNKGNVYNLLKQISSGRFLMVGKGNNKKSMAYIDNITEFIKYQLGNIKPGYQVYNYADKPDFSMNELVSQVEKSLNKHIPATHFPYWLGMLGGYGFDVLSFITQKKFSVNSIRVKKFCATTQFDSTKVQNSGFIPPYTLSEGLHKTLQNEFLDNKNLGH